MTDDELISLYYMSELARFRFQWELTGDLGYAN